MTISLQYLAFFILGFLCATILAWFIHHHYTQAWVSQYSKLMAGIQRIYEGIEMHEGKTSCNSDTYQWSPLCAAYRLRQLFNGDQ